MTVKDLVDSLKNFDQKAEIMILDGFNGGGHPREINCGPFTHEVSTNDESSTADCEGWTGREAVVMGFGCY